MTASEVKSFDFCHSDEGRISLITISVRFFTPLLNYVRRPSVCVQNDNFEAVLFFIDRNQIIIHHLMLVISKLSLWSHSA